ncbi:MAG: DUF481 domain-containing protein [Bacteroidota bacterium]|nr:DUF481 domain-containing protein [Bacteroidota bacterium]
MRLTSLLIFIPIITFSQIVSVEDKRQSDKKGLSGFTEFTFNYKKTIKTDWKLSNISYLQWDNKSWSFLLLNEINLDRAGGIVFSNDGYQHLRISNHINKSYTIESFIQNQYDPLRSIKNRKLLGSGLRLEIFNQNFVGLSSFYENEILNNGLEISAFRLNTYFDIKIEVNKILLFLITTYIQPNINKLGDCKVSNKSSIRVKISDKFSLSNIFSGSYDTYPASGIPEFTYNIKNGLIYKF